MRQTTLRLSLTFILIGSAAAQNTITLYPGATTQRGTLASIPTTCLTGDIYVATDQPAATQMYTGASGSPCTWTLQAGGGGLTSAGYVLSETPTLGTSQYQWGTNTTNCNTTVATAGCINQYYLATGNPTSGGSFSHNFVHVMRYSASSDGTGTIGLGADIFADHAFTGTFATGTHFAAFHYDGMVFANSSTHVHDINPVSVDFGALNGGVLDMFQGVRVSPPITGVVDFAGMVCCYPKGFSATAGQFAALWTGYPSAFGDLTGSIPAGRSQWTTMYNDPTNHKLWINPNNEGNQQVTGRVCIGTVTLPTTAIAAGAAGADTTASCTGAASTDTLKPQFQGDTSGTTGYLPGASLEIRYWITSGTLHFMQINNTTASITPAAITLNYTDYR